MVGAGCCATDDGPGCVKASVTARDHGASEGGASLGAPANLERGAPIEGGETERGAGGANRLLREGTAIGRSEGCCSRRPEAPWPIRFFTRVMSSCG